MEVWGQSPQQGLGQSPGQGSKALVRGAKPPEAESYLALKRPKKHIICHFCALCKVPRNPKKFLSLL